MTTQTPAALGSGLTNPDDPRHPRYLQTMRDRLVDYAEHLRDADWTRTKKRRELAETGRRFADLQSDLQMDVATETNGEGKLRYGNAESRAAALSKAIRDNGHTRALRAQMDLLETDLAKLDVEFEQARRARASTLALLDFAGRWLGYWANHTEDEG